MACRGGRRLVSAWSLVMSEPKFPAPSSRFGHADSINGGGAWVGTQHSVGQRWSTSTRAGTKSQGEAELEVDSDPEALWRSLVADEAYPRYWSESVWSHDAEGAFGSGSASVRGP